MIMNFTKITTGIIALVAFSVLNAKLPSNQYACHVSTIIDVDGIVLIQADNIRRAANVALESKARTVNGKYVKTFQVEQCIVPFKDKFKDKEIQKFFENMPM